MPIPASVTPSARPRRASNHVETTRPYVSVECPAPTTPRKPYSRMNASGLAPSNPADAVASAKMTMAGNAMRRTPTWSTAVPTNGIISAPVMWDVTTAEASTLRDQPNSALIGCSSTPNVKRMIGPLPTTSASVEPNTTSQPAETLLTPPSGVASALWTVDSSIHPPNRLPFSDLSHGAVLGLESRAALFI